MNLRTAVRIAATRPPPMLASMHLAANGGSTTFLEEVKLAHARRAEALAIVRAHEGVPIVHAKGKPKKPSKEDLDPSGPPGRDEDDDHVRPPSAEDDDDDADDSEDLGDDDDDKDDSEADHDRAPRRTGKQRKKFPDGPQKKPLEDELAAATLLLAWARAALAKAELERRARVQARRYLARESLMTRMRFDPQTRARVQVRLDTKPAREDRRDVARGLRKAGLDTYAIAESIVAADAKDPIDTSMSFQLPMPRWIAR